MIYHILLKSNKPKKKKKRKKNTIPGYVKLMLYNTREVFSVWKANFCLKNNLFKILTFISCINIKKNNAIKKQHCIKNKIPF